LPESEITEDGGPEENEQRIRKRNGNTRRRRGGNKVGVTGEESKDTPAGDQP